MDSIEDDIDNKNTINIDIKDFNYKTFIKICELDKDENLFNFLVYSFSIY